MGDTSELELKIELRDGRGDFRRTWYQAALLLILFYQTSTNEAAIVGSALI